jgi:replicative DNA helicase
VHDNNIEHALLSKVIETREFRILEKAKIDESYFFTPEGQEVYRFIRDIYHATATAGSVPSRELVQQQFRSFPFFNSNDDVAVLTEILRKGKIAVEVQMLAERLMMTVGTNPLEALADLRAATPGLSALADQSEDFSMAAAYNMLKARYEMVQGSKGVIGIPYPWQPLNEATQGMKRQNFIVVYGRPKSMKTWWALKIAVSAYVESRRRVLFYSREMSHDEILGRAACILAEVDYHEYLNGRLQPQVRDHLFGVLADLVEDEKYAGANNGGRNPFFIVTTDRDAEDGGGVSWLQAKIEETEPDIAFVDGMYLMKDDRTKSRSIDWKNISHISQDLKLTARRFDIPVVGITQAKRSAEQSHGEDLTELAFADSIGMDADCVFRVSKKFHVDPVLKKKVVDLLITAPGVRESGVFEGMVIRADPGHTFELRKVLTGLDADERSNYGEAPTGGSSTPRPVARFRSSSFRNDGTLKDPKVPL